jgi:rod shape-determining protein MreB
MSLSGLLGLFSSDLAIDLGTASTLVYVRGRGIAVVEPSIVAVNRITNRVEAVGTKAKEMLGKTPSNIQAIRPMKDGVIADFEVTEKMLEHFIKKAHGRSFLVRPRIVISVPSEITQVEKRAVKDTALKAGASEVYLIEQAMAAALGAGLPITEPSGNMIVDIGGGTSDVAVISLAGVVLALGRGPATRWMRQSSVPQEVQPAARRADASSQDRDRIRLRSGSADHEVKGRDLVEGIPRPHHRRREIREALTRSCHDWTRSETPSSGLRAVGRHHGQGHHPGRRRLVAEEPRQAAARGDRPAGGALRGADLGGGPGHRHDADQHRPAAEDRDPGLRAGLFPCPQAAW